MPPLCGSQREGCERWVGSRAPNMLAQVAAPCTRAQSPAAFPWSSGHALGTVIHTGSLMWHSNTRDQGNDSLPYTGGKLRPCWHIACPSFMGRMWQN